MVTGSAMGLPKVGASTACPRGGLGLQRQSLGRERPKRSKKISRNCFEPASAPLRLTLMARDTVSPFRARATVRTLPGLWRGRDRAPQRRPARSRSRAPANQTSESLPPPPCCSRQATCRRMCSGGLCCYRKGSRHRPLNALLTRSTALRPSGSDGASSENVLKSANARCRSLFRSRARPRL